MSYFAPKHYAYTEDFTSVAALCEHFGVELPARLTEWRLVYKGPIGRLQGLPIEGRLLATNGVLAFLETGTRLFLCHMANFIPETGEEFQDPFQPLTKSQQRAVHDMGNIVEWLRLQPDGPARRFVQEKYFGGGKKREKGKKEPNIDIGEFV